MTIGGESGAGARDHTPSRHAPSTRTGSSIGGSFLPLEYECRPSDWYIGRIPWRHRNRSATLPNYRPRTSAELKKAGVTRVGLRDNWVKVDYGMYVHVNHLLPATTDSDFPRARRVHPATLALAHLIRHPGRIATGFAASSFYGMRYFVDEELLAFLTSTGTRRTGAPDHVLLHPTRLLDLHRSTAVPVHEDHRKLKCADAHTTLSHMLESVSVPDALREQRWNVPDLSRIRSHLTPDFIRCVQVSDACHQSIGNVSPADPRKLRVPGGVDVMFAASVLGSTDVGAESPQETLLRLAVNDLAPGLRSQIPVFKEDGKLLTVSDLGWGERGLHLMYDGVHHRQREQRDHDSEVLAALQHGGGRVIRVTAGNLASMAEIEKLRERVVGALE
ncbi:hypothetical protein [Corynebacterium variabile]|uniref:hypothetical protein n=1 Tax=Corynebacterium variabile TaxID=1727 RepID=UPI003F97EE62